jgi:ATP-dependent Clp protease ATP-binding subunit ClpC
MNEAGFYRDLIVLSRALPEALGANILGQEEPLSEVCELLQRALCGARLPDRPVASMLFAGPTGTGKTESARLIVLHLYGSEARLARVDCSELQHKDAAGVLIGTAPGERGLLGPLYDRTAGYGVLLFDEVEKAYPLVLDLFLQLLSAARLGLASGETLDFRRYIVIATSNLGSRILLESKTLNRAYLVRRTLQAVQDFLRPEIYRRFEAKVVFNRLSFEALCRIADLHLAKTLERAGRDGHRLTAGPGVAGHIRRVGYSEEYGAGPMEQAALDVVGGVIKDARFSNGGRPVAGVVTYDRKTNRCFLSHG